MWRVGKPLRIVDIEIIKDCDFRAWRLKSNCVNYLRSMVKCPLLVELGERYRVQMNLEM